MRKPAVAITIALAALVACSKSNDGTTREGAGSVSALMVHPSQRAVLRAVGTDTLSDSALVTRVLPERDGTSVPFLFSDPSRRVASGLAITGQDNVTQLLWPDSVVDVWWTGPHALAFTTRTGQGVRLVVDVHAAKLAVAEQSGPSARPAPTDTTVSSDIRSRAQRYVDSLHAQPGGGAAPARGSALRYQVGRITVDPSGRFAAFHVVALDSAGRRSNPAWYALAVRGGDVERIDGIIGDVRDLAENAGGWTEDDRFIYAKGLMLFDAHVMGGE